MQENRTIFCNYAVNHLEFKVNSEENCTPNFAGIYFQTTEVLFLQLFSVSLFNVMLEIVIVYSHVALNFATMIYFSHLV